VQQARALALARHLDRPSSPAAKRLGAPVTQLCALVDHRPLVGLALHVDEVHDDDAADVAQPELARHFLRRLHVGAEDGLFLVLLAGETPGVDVDRHQRLGVVDADVAALLEPHLALERLLDLRLDLERVEDRVVPLVELDRRAARARPT
jgi:hypothetical protein